MASIWRELGINETSDRKAVQRAYAAKLKAVKGDNEAFMRLRAAYEAAIGQIQHAEWIMQEAQAELSQEDISANDTPVEQPPASVKRDEPVNEPSDPTAIVWKAFDAALAVRDPQAAMAVLEGAMAQGSVPLGMHDGLAEQVLALALEDTTLSPESYLTLVRRAGWGPSVGRIPYWSPVYQKIIDRAEVELWYLRLVALAAAPPPQWELYGLGGPKLKPGSVLTDTKRNAMLFFAPEWPFLILDAERQSELRGFLAEYDHHRPGISARIPARRVQHIQRWLKLSQLAKYIWGWLVVVLFTILVLGAIASGTHYAIFGIFVLGRIMWMIARQNGWRLWWWR